MSSRSSRTPRKRRRGGVRRSGCRAAAAERRVLAAHDEVDVERVRPETSSRGARRSSTRVRFWCAASVGLGFSRVHLCVSVADLYQVDFLGRTSLGTAQLQKLGSGSALFHLDPCAASLYGNSS
jgi:hypothetical protein